MAALKIILIIIHVMVSTALIICVLLHSGKGGGLTGMLGGGSSGVFGGGYMAERKLDRVTVVLGCVFAVTTLLLVWRLNPK